MDNVMKKREKAFFLIGTFFAVSVIMFLYFYITKVGRHPFADLQETDIKQAYILYTAYPSNEPYPLNQEDTKELVAALQEIVFYQMDNSYMDYDGCSFTMLIIEKPDGEILECYAGNPFFIINGEGHRTKYGPSDALGRLLHSFVDKAFAEGYFTK